MPENSASETVYEKNTFYRPVIVKTKDLRIPNQYTLALDGEFRDYAYNEERAPMNQGKWRSEIFKTANESCVDLEIGTGNGVHFRERCRREADRFLVGLELKYKPLVQTIRGMLRIGSTNGRICRSHAFNVDTLFAEGELNNIYMQFPDPWTSPRKPKNRMVNPRMISVFHSLQRPGSYFELKTDSEEYYRWSVEHFENCVGTDTPYEQIHISEDWHKDPGSEGEVKTQFENIFARQGLPIYYGLWRRVDAPKKLQDSVSKESTPTA